MSVTNTSALPLPPFGKILEAYCGEKIHLSQPIHIYLGKEAREICMEAHRWQNMWTYLPPGKHFTQFKWPVFGQNVLIYDLEIRTAEYSTQFAIHLLGTYSPKCVVIHSDYFPLKILNPFGVTHHG